MNTDSHQKVTADHLQRTAYLYVRQSTLQQVVNNTESKERQYDLRQRAIGMGWSADNVVVIDTDLAHSAKDAADREGFQYLVSEVGLGRAGIVLGLEVSRLARNNSDWHQLLEICGLTQTLILDEDGLYDPCHFNDRLLLGLKGTMSEAELHVLRARLRGGLENKARRGDLRSRLPIGYVYDQDDKIVFDPDQQIQAAVRKFFKTFEMQGTAQSVIKQFEKEGFLFPRRIQCGVLKDEVTWGPLVSSRVLQMLHNPCYAGAYSFGRSHFGRRLPRDQWHTLLIDHHPGYISWEQFERNEAQLRQNSSRYGHDRRKSPPGEGPALIQGLVVCGKCGRRMTLRYEARSSCTPRPYYVCQRESVQFGKPVCQGIQGQQVDEAISQLLLEKVTPMAMNVTLAVQEELATRQSEADALRRQQVERIRYEAEVAQQRYMKVDPRNRLVADSLEAAWNDKLRAVREAEELYERHRQTDLAVVDEKTREEFMSLARDFPRLWKDPRVSYRDRKRMVRLLIEDITLAYDDDVAVSIRFKGGATEMLRLPKPLSAADLRRTNPDTVKVIDQLLNTHTDQQVAAELNRRRLRSGEGREFNSRMIMSIRRSYQLKSLRQRLLDRGLLTPRQLAKELGVSHHTIRVWRVNGILKGHLCNDKNEFLYDPPGDDRPMKQQGEKLSHRRRYPAVEPNPLNEVHPNV